MKHAVILVLCVAVTTVSVCRADEKKERDTLEGLPEDVCSGALRPDCYPTPAKFKRVYKISLKDTDADGFVKKIGYVDLLNIKDPNGAAKREIRKALQATLQAAGRPRRAGRRDAPPKFDVADLVGARCK